MLILPENSPYQVGVRAIENIARNHYVHDDVEYRHVALLPVIKKEKRGGRKNTVEVGVFGYFGSDFIFL
jgi:hypothetical protein